MANSLRLVEDFIAAFPDAASQALEEQTPEGASGVVDAIADDLSAKALTNMAPDHAARCLQRLGKEAAARYLGMIAPQAAAMILRHAEPGAQRKLLDALPRNARIRIRSILRYSPATVGAWMDTRVLLVRPGLSAAKALERFRGAPEIEHSMIYVADENQQVCGCVPLARLMHAAESRPLAEIMQPATHRLRASASLDSVLFHVGWDTADQLPVMDRSDRCLGILRFAELRRAVAHHAPAAAGNLGSETILDLAGIWCLGLADLMAASFAPDLLDRQAEPFRQQDRIA